METTDSFFKSFVAVQAELKVPKGQMNKFGGYKYRSCEDIMEAVKPLLTTRGLILTVTDDIVQIGERYYVKATATVTDGDDLSHRFQVTAYAREPLDKKGMDDSQVTGAASSYARKYALNGMFCIDDTKDADTDEYAKQTNTGAKKPTTTPKQSEHTIICECCGKSITAFKAASGRSWTAQEVADSAMKSFGKYLCRTCAKAESDKLKGAESC